MSYKQNEIGDGDSEDSEDVDVETNEKKSQHDESTGNSFESASPVWFIQIIFDQVAKYLLVAIASIFLFCDSFKTNTSTTTTTAAATVFTKSKVVAACVRACGGHRLAVYCFSIGTTKYAYILLL